MVFDDHVYLLSNRIFAPESFRYPFEFHEFINRPSAQGMDPDFAINFVMRPVAYASFYLNYLFDGFNPHWYRLVNICIHAGNSLLIYGLILNLLRASPDRGRLKTSSVTFIAAASAVLFAVHPLAIESVTYIVQRFTSLVTLFCLLAIWLHFLAVQTPPGTRPRWLMRIGSIVALLMAMQTKESSFTIPVMVVILDRFVLATPWRSALKRSLPLLLCMPLIPALVLATSAMLHDTGIDLSAGMNIVNSRVEPVSHLHYIATQSTVVLHYLRLMIWPDGLNIDPDWPLYKSLFATPVVTSFCTLAGLALAAGYIFKKFRNDPRAALVGSFTAWFFVTISVSSSLIPLPDLVAEHRSYLPSIGVFVVIACLADWLRQLRMPSAVSRFALPAMSILVIGGLAWKTHTRNKCWSSNESLWRDTAAKSPGKFRVWGNLGVAVSNSGRNEEAITYLKKALEIEPSFRDGLLNLSNSYLRLNRPQASLEASQKLVNLYDGGRLTPTVAYNVGVGLFGVGRYEEAHRWLTAVAKSSPQDPLAHRALAHLYVATNKPRAALDHLETYQNLAANPSDVDPLINQLKALINGSSVQ